jgi:hypothetical protein
MKPERLIGPKHLPGGDAKQERVTNVPGGAGHSDFNGSFHGAISHNHIVESKRFLPPSPMATAWQATSLGMTACKSAVDFKRDVSG